MSPAEFADRVSVCIASLYEHALAEWDGAAEMDPAYCSAFLAGQLVAIKATLAPFPDPLPIELQVLLLAIDVCLYAINQDAADKVAGEPGATPALK